MSFAKYMEAKETQFNETLNEAKRSQASIDAEKSLTPQQRQAAIQAYMGGAKNAKRKATIADRESRGEPSMYSGKYQPMDKKSGKVEAPAAMRSWWKHGLGNLADKYVKDASGETQPDKEVGHKIWGKLGAKKQAAILKDLENAGEGNETGKGEVIIKHALGNTDKGVLGRMARFVNPKAAVRVARALGGNAKALKVIETLLAEGYNLLDVCQIVEEGLRLEGCENPAQVLYESLVELGVGRYSSRRIIAEALSD